MKVRRAPAFTSPSNATRPTVPMADDGHLPPPGDCLLAADYLLPTSRLKRRETTVEASLSELLTRVVQVDCQLPAGGAFGGIERTWYVPVAAFPKSRIAPKLEAQDASGGVIAIPTREENIVLTKRAVSELIESGRLPIEVDDDLRLLIDEVVERKTSEAHICRLVFELEEPPGPEAAQGREAAKPLLELLEGFFFLWVPLHGAPGSHHHITVSRTEIRRTPQLLVRGFEYQEEDIETAVGPVNVGLLVESGRYRPDLGTIVDRVLTLFALRPIEAGYRDVEAARSGSVHLRFEAPEGLLVRNVRAAEAQPPAEGNISGEVEELTSRSDGVVVQGHDLPLAHVHMARPANPQILYARITLTLRTGIITLWMLATLFSTALLWIVHHHSNYGGGHAHHHPQPFLVPAVIPALFAGAHHIAISSDNKQIAAAVLLAGPAFAAAWALRSDSSDTLRAVMKGSQLLLLVAAGLSVAAALALAGVVPGNEGRYRAVEVYATISYFVTVPMIAAWVISSATAWQVFRTWFSTERRNLVLLSGILIFCVAWCVVAGSPSRSDGWILLLAGISCLVISANSVGQSMLGGTTRYRPIALFAAIPLLLGAGALLGFYADMLDPDIARSVGVVGASVFAAIALGAIGVETKDVTDIR